MVIFISLFGQLLPRKKEFHHLPFEAFLPFPSIRIPKNLGVTLLSETGRVCGFGACVHVVAEATPAGPLWAPWAPPSGYHTFQLTHTCSHCSQTTIPGWLGLKGLLDLAPNPEILDSWFELGYQASLPPLMGFPSFFGTICFRWRLGQEHLRLSQGLTEHRLQRNVLSPSSRRVRVLRQHGSSPPGSLFCTGWGTIRQEKVLRAMALHLHNQIDLPNR